MPARPRARQSDQRRRQSKNPFDKTPEKSPPREWLVTLVNATVLPTMPITVVTVVVMSVMPIRAIIICVTWIVAAVIRPVVRWNTKSKSYMNSSLGLIRHPGHQTERHGRFSVRIRRKNAPECESSWRDRYRSRRASFQARLMPQRLHFTGFGCCCAGGRLCPEYSRRRISYRGRFGSLATGEARLKADSSRVTG
jgi:hypothetical protein